jgi:hypothetical protein
MNPVAMGNPAAPGECESRELIFDLFHQLSQPLTILCCSLELALLQTPGAEPYSEIVSQALGQAEKASSLATAIRELFDAGQKAERGQVLELRRAVEDAVGDFLPVADSAGVHVQCVPGAACPVWFDAPRLRQGLFHLIGFVIGSGGAGAVLTIELADRGTEAMLALTVSGACDNASDAHPDMALWRRVELGIARAIFEAAGGNFHAKRSMNRLSVEVGLPLKRE